MKYLRQFSMRTSNSSICNLRVLRGVFHHTTISANTFTPEQMKDGLPKLDGSSIVGFTSIHDSDLILKPGSKHICNYSLDNRKQNGKIVVRCILGRRQRSKMTLFRRFHVIITSQHQRFWEP